MPIYLACWVMLDGTTDLWMHIFDLKWTSQQTQPTWQAGADNCGLQGFVITL